jgi:hypothetical protein
MLVVIIVVPVLALAGLAIVYFRKNGYFAKLRCTLMPSIPQKSRLLDRPEANLPVYASKLGDADRSLGFGGNKESGFGATDTIEESGPQSSSEYLPPYISVPCTALLIKK